MNDRLIRWLLNSYLAKWRAEYGPELEALLRGRSLRMSDVRNVLWSGLKERIRQPFARFLLFLLLGSTFSLIISGVFSDPLWRTLTNPMISMLREQGARPSALVQVTPYEGLEVIWLGIPLLVTAFFTFVWLLLLTWVFFAQVKDLQKRQWANRFVLCSGTVFVLSSVLSFTAWQNGCTAKLLALYPDPQNAPLVSVWHCFVLLALSTLGLTSLLQIPVFAIFGWRFRAIQALKTSVIN